MEHRLDRKPGARHFAPLAWFSRIVHPADAVPRTGDRRVDTAPWPLIPRHAPANPLRVAEPDSPLDPQAADALAHAILTIAATARGGVSAERIAALAMLRNPAWTGARVAATVTRLVADRHLAAYGNTHCLPERIAALRHQWLVTALLASARAHPSASDALPDLAMIDRIRRWDGWNVANSSLDHSRITNS